MPRFYVRTALGPKGQQKESIVLDRAFCHREVFWSASLRQCEERAAYLNEKHA